MRVRIYYHDTDAGNVVYYANYLKYMEEARTEFLEDRGILLKDLARQGILFVVARQEIDYKAPAFYADTLEISAKLTSISTVKLEYEHEVKNQESRLICTGKAVLVCVGKDFKPQAIPEEVRKKLSQKPNAKI